jgi:hypothetical protein
MLNQSDPYWKLRPAPPTPADEICTCTNSPPLLLQPCLSPNPLACLKCNLEVPPEQVGFSEELADDLARWRNFYECFYRLWLDSDEFESWAQIHLENPKSLVNQRGLALVAALNHFRRTYYGWFQAEEAEDSQPLAHCPVCKTQLSAYSGDSGKSAYGGGTHEPKTQRSVCERCSIAMPN